MRRKIVAGVLAVAGAAAALALTRGGVSSAAQAVPTATPVWRFAAAELARPQAHTLADAIEISGPLVAPATAIVRTRAAGTLHALSVNEGSRVRAGQSLGRYETSELDQRVAERAAALESAHSAWLQAQRQHDSNQQLAGQDFISPNALETSRSALAAARAARQSAQAQLDAARAGQREAALVAPIGGWVARRHALPGEKLAAEQPVLTIVDLATLELAGSVGTHQVARLSAGMPVVVSVEGASAPMPGRLARIAPAAEPGSRSIGVTVELANPRESLRAGQYAVARVQLQDATPALTLPTTAVALEAGQPLVWAIEQGVLRRRAVRLGRRDEASGRVELLGGLAPDAQVLAARFDGLREGQPATVQ